MARALGSDPSRQPSGQPLDTRAILGDCRIVDPYDRTQVGVNVHLLLEHLRLNCRSGQTSITAHWRCGKDPREWQSDPRLHSGAF